MNPFSIVVPYLSDSKSFDDTLASVLRYRPLNSEVILVHDGSYLDPHGLHGEITLVTTSQRKSDPHYQAACLISAVAQCSGWITVWIRPGIELDEGWESSLPIALAEQGVASVTPLLAATNQPTIALTTGIDTDRAGTRRSVKAGATVSTALKTARPLGPTSWLAAWRTDLLRSVLSLAAETEDRYLDVELGLSLRHIGFRTTVCDNFAGFVDDPRVVLKDMQWQHGESAQRGYEKYLGRVGKPSLWQNVARDLISASVSPWKLQHAMQRLKVGKWRRRDAQQMRRLQDLRDDALSADGQNISLPLRRAA